MLAFRYDNSMMFMKTKALISLEMNTKLLLGKCIWYLGCFKIIWQIFLSNARIKQVLGNTDNCLKICILKN